MQIGKILDAILDLDIEKDWFEIGRLMRELRKQSPTYEIFKDYVKETGLGERTAYYLIGAYESLYTRGVPPPEDVHYRKVVEVAKIVRQDNAQKVWEFCRNHNWREVVKAMKERKIEIL